jgi:hypothetical protein
LGVARLSAYRVDHVGREIPSNLPRGLNAEAAVALRNPAWNRYQASCALRQHHGALGVSSSTTSGGPWLLGERIKMVFIDHHHDGTPEQFPPHDTLIDPLAFAGRIAHVADFVPVEETGPLIVAPELRTGIELSEVGERLFKSPLLPVGRAPRAQRGR